jgi:hypothetical protein
MVDNAFCSLLHLKRNLFIWRQNITKKLRKKKTFKWVEIIILLQSWYYLCLGTFLAPKHTHNKEKCIFVLFVLWQKKNYFPIMVWRNCCLLFLFYFFFVACLPSLLTIEDFLSNEIINLEKDVRGLFNWRNKHNNKNVFHFL